jgi:phosphate transport system ATP-binding protein
VSGAERPAAGGEGGSGADEAPALRAESLSAWYGGRLALSTIDLSLARHTVTALLGPAGAGKSTLLRCCNRMLELEPGARVEGRVLLFGDDVYRRSVDPAALRRDVALVASPPLPFPTMSIRDNVLAGLRLGGLLGAEAEPASRVEGCLKEVGLWHELKDRLGAPPLGLSAGARLRLCVARALALRPRVVLLDQPFASLDPEASARLEELVDALRERHTLVVVPSTLQQAGRTCTHAALLLGGRLVEFGRTAEMLRSPRHPETEDYLTGKFG